MTVPALPTPPLEPAKPIARRRLWLAVGGGALLLALGVLLVFAILPSALTRPQDPGSVTPGAATAEGRRIQATLFYVADDGAELVPVQREVPYGATPSEQARHLIETQVAAAPQGQISAIAAGTKVRAVFLAARGEAYVDLSAEARSAHTGGSLNEALAVFAIVNALTANLADVKTVQILIDGKEVDTLAGHVDLRQPLGQAQKWVRKAQ